DVLKRQWRVTRSWRIVRGQSWHDEWSRYVMREWRVRRLGALFMKCLICSLRLAKRWGWMMKVLCGLEGRRWCTERLWKREEMKTKEQRDGWSLMNWRKGLDDELGELAFWECFFFLSIPFVNYIDAFGIEILEPLCIINVY